MRVLVTGAGGFIGSYLLPELSKTHEVAVLLLPGEKLRGLPPEEEKKYRIFRGNVTEPESLREAARFPEAVVHAAGLIKALSNADYDKVNHLGTANLARVLSEENPGLKFFLLFSSSAAGGVSATRENPIREDMPADPIGPYGISKLNAEKSLETFSFKKTSFRITSVYGGGSSEHIEYFKMARLRLSPRLGLGEKYFCMIHARDLARAVNRVVTNWSEAQPLYYLSDGKIYSWTEVGVAVNAYYPGWKLPLPLPKWICYVAAFFVGLVAKVRRQPAVLDVEKMRLLLKSYITCDSSRFRKQFPDFSFTDFSDGLRETYDWYKAHGWL